MARADEAERATHQHRGPPPGAKDYNQLLREERSGRPMDRKEAAALAYYRRVKRIKMSRTLGPWQKRVEMERADEEYEENAGSPDYLQRQVLRGITASSSRASIRERAAAADVHLPSPALSRRSSGSSSKHSGRRTSRSSRSSSGRRGSRSSSSRSMRSGTMRKHSSGSSVRTHGRHPAHTPSPWCQIHWTDHRARSIGMRSGRTSHRCPEKISRRCK